jgi:hypothetical protein
MPAGTKLPVQALPKSTNVESKLAMALMGGMFATDTFNLLQSRIGKDGVSWSDRTTRDLKGKINRVGTSVRESLKKNVQNMKTGSAKAADSLKKYGVALGSIAMSHPYLLLFAGAVLAGAAVIYRAGKDQYWFTGSKELMKLALKDQLDLVKSRKYEYDKIANKEQTLLNLKKRGIAIDEKELQMLGQQKAIAMSNWEKQYDQYTEFKQKVEDYFTGPSKFSQKVQSFQAQAGGTPEYSSPTKGFKPAGTKKSTGAIRAAEKRIQNAWWTKMDKWYGENQAPYDYAANMGDKAVGSGTLSKENAPAVGAWGQTEIGRNQLYNLQDSSLVMTKYAAAISGDTYDPATQVARLGEWDWWTAMDIVGGSALKDTLLMNLQKQQFEADAVSAYKTGQIGRGDDTPWLNKIFGENKNEGKGILGVGNQTNTINIDMKVDGRDKTDMELGSSVASAFLNVMGLGNMFGGEATPTSTTNTPLSTNTTTNTNTP